MAKIILLVLAAVAIYWFFSGRQKRQTHRQTKQAAAEKMVVCAHCHLHIPESESVAANGSHFCCEEHRRLGVS